MVLPQFGGPTNRIEWFPAAATSNARFPFVTVNDAGRIVPVGRGLGSPGNFIAGLTVQGSQFVVGKGKKVHGMVLSIEKNRQE